jgi:hypothetical protein
VTRTILWGLAVAAIFAIAAGSAVPADAAKKRNKAATGGQASNQFVDSIDLPYVAGHGSPSTIKKRVRPRRLRAK